MTELYESLYATLNVFECNGMSTNKINDHYGWQLQFEPIGHHDRELRIFAFMSVLFRRTTNQANALSMAGLKYRKLFLLKMFAARIPA
jgi:hypothetical protein